MEYILIISIIILLVMVFIMYFKLQAVSQYMSHNQDHETSSQLHTILNNQQLSMNNLHQQNVDSKIIAERLKNMNDSVQTLLKDTTLSYAKVEDISARIIALNDIMVNKKSRGNWGEYQLNNLLSIYAGDNQEIFEVQYLLNNGAIGDVALHLPGTAKVMIIDSKFPLENYQHIMTNDLSEAELKKYENLFKQNIRKHINDIAQKYITAQTAESAVMFIPSEAIYMHICAHYSDLIEFAHNKHVLITSPTTLIGVVFTLVNLTKDFKRSKNIKSLEKDIVRMYEDVNRLYTRLEKVDNNINTLQKSFKDVKTSSEKIGNKIIRIHDGYIPEEND